MVDDERRDDAARELCRAQLEKHNPGRSPEWIDGRIGDAWQSHRAEAQRQIDAGGPAS